jgi:hypothetical protein
MNIVLQNVHIEPMESRVDMQSWYALHLGVVLFAVVT